MKFILTTTIVVISATVAMVSAASGRTNVRRAKINGHSLSTTKGSNNRKLTQLLLQDAIPVDRELHVVRRMDEANAAAADGEEAAADEQAVEQEEFELTSQYSIRFDTCVSLSTGPNVEGNNNNNNGNMQQTTLLFNDDLVQYTKEGKIVNEKSYVLFSACKTEDCSYEADESLYLIDLNTYMKVLASYYEVDQQSYCTACAANVDYCE